MVVDHPKCTRWTLLVASALLAAGCGDLPAGAPDEAEGDAISAVAQRSLAQIEGDLDVPGLQQPVEVIRDRWGIPHIYAQNTEDLFFAQGYVMAQDRLWQMELWRLWREGRLAEVFGPEAFEYDVRSRLMAFRGPFDASEWTSYHPEGELIFSSYANGVNAFIEQNRDNLPMEFQLTGLQPDPWTAETVVLRWASIGLSSVRGHPISEIQLAMNVAEYGAEEANRRAAPDPWDDLQVPEGLDLSVFTQELLDAARAGDGDPYSRGALPPLEIVEPYRNLVSEVALLPSREEPDLISRSYLEGSNNWVVSGRLTPSGVPILANDPHRRIEMPALRYFVHLNAPGWNLSGGGEPPFVGTDAGHNERMAWGFTFAGTDMVDLYVEDLHPEDDNLVRWQDGWEPLRTVTEEIAVKGEAPRTVEHKFSRHGPVFYVDLERRKAFAVRSVLQEPGTAAYKGSFKLAQAEGCEDFFERAMFWMVPTHSLICGDVEGNIAIQITGLTPDRDGWNGRLPVPGTGQYEWQGFREDLPREFNPERGYIATANNNVHPPGYTGRPVFYHSSRGVDFARITRLHQILGSGEKFTVEQHGDIQHDNHSLEAAAHVANSFQGWTSEDPDVERARALIAEWDANYTKDSAAGALYVTWDDVADAAARDLETPAAQRRPLVEEGLKRAVEELTAEQGSDWSQWRYGRIHNSDLPHSVVARYSLPTVERSGGSGSVNATGANFRRVLDLSDWDASIGTNAPGQSAQPESPFYGDLLPYLDNGEYFPMLYSREAVEANEAYRLMLRPGGR